MYAKIINNELQFAPQDYVTEGNIIINFNLDENLMREYGYKPLIEAEKPTCPFIITYDEDEDKITEIVTIDAEQNQINFETEFFETSLGWIRREVNMANGTTKDFLSDLFPTICMAVTMNQPVTIITYAIPDFTQEITDWTIYQEEKSVTPQFIQECFAQLSNDFRPSN